MLALAALGAMELGAFGARDVVVTGRGAPGEKPYAVKLRRLTLDKIAGAKAREASIEDFALDSADGGHVALRHLALRGLDFNALLAPGEARTWRLDRAEAEGVVADLPDAGADGRVKFEIGALAADFANYREGVATKFAVRLDRLKADLAARGESPAAHFFMALGYRDIALSGELAGVWREEARAFEIERARVDAKDMGAVTLQATFGNVGASVFSPSPIVSRAAMLTATVTRLEATVEGGGLIERVLAEEAEIQRRRCRQAARRLCARRRRRDRRFAGEQRKGPPHWRGRDEIHQPPDAPAHKTNLAQGRRRGRSRAKKARRNSERAGGRGRGAVRARGRLFSRLRGFSALGPGLGLDTRVAGRRRGACAGLMLPFIFFFSSGARFDVFSRRMSRRTAA